MKSIFVTGAAGFIGANLVKRLFKDLKGVTIVELPPLRTPRPWNGTSASPRRQRCGKACGSLRNGMPATICRAYSKFFCPLINRVNWCSYFMYLCGRNLIAVKFTAIKEM